MASIPTQDPDTPIDETTIEENAEQRDADQAQDVAGDAMGRGGDLAEESRHGGRRDPGAILPRDVPDLVDKMNEMLRSGHIDNDAYAGEPMHDDEDDEDDILGTTDDENDDF